MTPRGLEPLVAMRLERKLPGREVILWCGDFKPSKWALYPDFFLMPNGVTKSVTDDYRVFFGLDVVLVAASYSDQFAGIIEKLKINARSILAIPLDWAGDMIVWPERANAPAHRRERRL